MLVNDLRRVVARKSQPVQIEGTLAQSMVHGRPVQATSFVAHYERAPDASEDFSHVGFVIARLRTSRSFCSDCNVRRLPFSGGTKMNRCIVAVALLLTGTIGARADPLVCAARLLHIEDTNWWVDGHPVARMTFRVTPPRGPAYQATIEGAASELNPPRRGSTLRVSCDPANPADLHPIN
jgi:hypothetical protein